MTNCPNCGAPIEPYKIHCDYCGSYYYDLCALNCIADKPVYIKFRAECYGQTVDITALARPSLETIEINEDPVYVSDYSGHIIREFHSGKSVEMVARFRCIPNKYQTLFEVEYEGK